MAVESDEPVAPKAPSADNVTERTALGVIGVGAAYLEANQLRQTSPQFDPSCTEVGKHRDNSWPSTGRHRHWADFEYVGATLSFVLPMLTEVASEPRPMSANFGRDSMGDFRRTWAHAGLQSAQTRATSTHLLGSEFVCVGPGLNNLTHSSQNRPEHART